MALVRRDEVLEKALSTDETAIPRFNIIDADGNVIYRNARLELANRVVTPGTPINKVALDEILAASGVTGGTSTAYTLAQENFALSDGAKVRFRLHAATGSGATLNVNGTGAKPLRDMMGAPMASGIPAGAWIEANYSAATGAYVLSGGEAVRALYGERHTVDDAVAYVKDVPEDVLSVAEVGEIGGMTHRVNMGTEMEPVYELRSAAVTEMKSVGVNLCEKMVPFANVSVSGGAATQIVSDTRPYLDFIIQSYNNSNFISVLVRFGAILTTGRYSFNFTKDASYNRLVFGHNGEKNDVKCSVDIGELLDGETYTISIDFTNITQGSFSWKNVSINKGTTALPYTPFQRHTLPIPEAVRALDGYGESNPDDATEYNAIKWFGNGERIYLHRGSIVDGAWVPLAKEEVTDISDILPADNLLPVEVGGTVTAVNEYGYDTPSTIAYQNNVLDNRASTYAAEKLRLSMELLASIDYVDQGLRDVAKRSKVISTTRITTAAKQIDIPVPSGYTRYRLIAAGLSVDYSQDDSLDTGVFNLRVNATAQTISSREYAWEIGGYSQVITSPDVTDHTNGRIGSVPASRAANSAYMQMEIFKSGDNWAGTLNGNGSSYDGTAETPSGFCYATFTSSEISTLSLVCTDNITAGMILLEGLA